MGECHPWKLLLIFFITLTFCGISSAHSVEERSYKSRIAGGYVTSIREHPHRVVLYPLLCGGTIIHKKWIVTASKCFHPHLSVLVGHDNITGIESGNMKVRRSIRKRTNIWHQDKFEPIMLIELNDELELNKDSVMIAPLYKGPLINRTVGFVAGFGAMDIYTHNTTILRAIEIPLCLPEECIAKFPRYEKILSTNPQASFCAGFDFSRVHEIGGHHSHCKGDYGGGFIIQGMLAGVAIDSFECGAEKTPAVFASVLNVREWIITILYPPTITTSIDSSTKGPTSETITSDHVPHVIYEPPFDVDPTPEPHCEPAKMTYRFNIKVDVIVDDCKSQCFSG